MKMAVDRVGRGKERQVNIRFLVMTNHYVFEPEGLPCRANVRTFQC